MELIKYIKWLYQGKYNLTPEKLKEEEERIKKYFDYSVYMFDAHIKGKVQWIIFDNLWIL